MGAESFTVLAILEARDRASEIFAKVDESLGKFSESAGKAAESASAAGAKIDEALGRVVPASGRLEVADARLGAAQAKAAESAQALTDAEKELLDAQKAAAAAGGEDAAAADRLVAADARLAGAQKDAAVAAKGLKDAQAGQVTALKASAAAGDENAAAQVRMKEKSSASAISLGTVGKVAGITALGLAVAAGIMVKSAGNFQDSTTHLVTDAGESAKNLGMVQAGILKVSTATGQSAASITNAMYHVESSGFHGASGLAILKTAAEGARIGGADLDTTSKALVGTLTAYYGTSLTAAQATKDSTSLMSELVATVGSGDMRMQDLASSLHSVTAVAASAHIPFAEVGAAIATMTAQGMSAEQATLDLGHVMGSLQNPTNVQSTEMKALGLNANALSKNLGAAGLAGTLNKMRDAVLKNTSGGYVMLGYLKQMSPAAQGVANQIMGGSISTSALTKSMKTLSPQQAHMVTMFKAAAISATGLRQTYSAAMSKMLGGQMGLNVGLMLTGTHMKDLTRSTAGITSAGKSSAAMTAAWATIQSTFNFKLDQAKTGVENTGIAIGTALLPAVTSILSAVTKIVIPIAEWTSRNKALTEVIFVGVTAIAATIAVIAGLRKAYKAVTGAVDTVKATLKALGLISKETAAAQASSAQAAAAAQEASSAEAAGAMEADAAEVAVANEEAAAESAGVWGEQAILAVAYAAGWVVGQVTKVAAVVASNVAGAAATAGAWLASAGSAVAGAAVWVGETIAKVAVVVASNVAGAAVTMAAWIAANAAMLLGIGLIVIAVVAAVALIVTHWKQVSAFAKKAFHEVLAIVDSVIGWVKSHWPLLLGILLGPIALAAALIATHYRQILAVIDSAISWVRGHWPLLLAILTGPVGLAVLWITGHFDQITAKASAIVGDVAAFFRALPGQIAAAIGDLGYIGMNIVIGIWNGLSSKASWLWGQVTGWASSVVGSIKSAFGIGSPSKYTTEHGRQLGAGVAVGLLASLPQVLSATRKVTSAVLAATSGMGAAGHGTGAVLGTAVRSSAAEAGPGLAALGGGGTGGAVVTIDLRGAQIMSDRDMDALVTKIGPAVARALGAAGYKVRMG